MRRGLAVAAALAAFALAGCSSTPAMTAADAREFARRALVSVGFPEVRVAPEVAPGRYTSPEPQFADRSIDVFQTRSQVPGGEIELYVPRKGDRAVYVRDAAVAGGQLLTDAQFHQLEQFRYNAAEQRQRHNSRRVGAAGVALVVIMVAALLSTVFTGAADKRRRLHARGASPPSPAPDIMIGSRAPWRR